MPRWSWSIGACLLMALPVWGEDKPQAKYESLLAKVKKGDAKVDFKALRMVFTETSAYAPYSVDSAEREAMFAALDKQDYSKAAQLADKVLQQNFLDIKAHSVAMRANAELKKDELATFHERVKKGLIQSILDSGDGKSAKTAYVVITTEEEYAVLDALGVRSGSQGLLAEGESKFDRIEGVDRKSGKRVTLFFDVTKPFGWLTKSLKPKK